MRPADPTFHRVHATDAHENHDTANAIAYCTEHAADLLTIPPHSSHMLQSLGVKVFTSLRHTLVPKTNAVSRLDRLGFGDMESVPVEVATGLHEFGPLVWGCSAIFRADKLPESGWRPNKVDWRPLMREGGKRA